MVWSFTAVRKCLFLLYSYSKQYTETPFGKWERGEACIRFWWGNLRQRDHWGDSGVDGRIILRWFFRKWGVGVGLD
jgi:hypothetical protein